MIQLLNELLKISRLDDDRTEEDREAEDAGYASLDLDTAPAEDDIDLNDDTNSDEDGLELPTDEDELGEIDDGAESDELGAEPDELDAETEPEDPNKAGLIRKVEGAHLVYKRAREDGTYSELWAYKVDSVKKSVAIRNAILAGTDIERNKSSSEDGSQEYKTWSAGNLEMVSITGLPS